MIAILPHFFLQMEAVSEVSQHIDYSTLDNLHMMLMIVIVFVVVASSYLLQLLWNQNKALTEENKSHTREFLDVLNALETSLTSLSTINDTNHKEALQALTSSRDSILEKIHLYSELVKTKR